VKPGAAYSRSLLPKVRLRCHGRQTAAHLKFYTLRVLALAFRYFCKFLQITLQGIHAQSCCVTRRIHHLALTVQWISKKNSGTDRVPLCLKSNTRASHLACANMCFYYDTSRDACQCRQTRNPQACTGRDHRRKKSGLWESKPAKQYLCLKSQFPPFTIDMFHHCPRLIPFSTVFRLPIGRRGDTDDRFDGSRRKRAIPCQISRP